MTWLKSNKILPSQRDLVSSYIWRQARSKAKECIARFLFFSSQFDLENSKLAIGRLKLSRKVDHFLVSK